MPDTTPSRNLVASVSQVGRVERERLLGQKGCVVWFTGLSGSGKSTIARGLEANLVHAGRLAYVLDGDNLRMGLNRNLGFSHEDRTENIRRAGEAAALLADCGILVITGLISPYRVDRAMARAMVPQGRFLEVWLSTSLAECERRDPKGLYRRARAGEIEEFTGISAPYETPERADIAIDTAVTAAGQAIGLIKEALASRGFLA